MKQNNIDTSKMLETAKNAIHIALLYHKAIGNEIVFFKDGKIGSSGDSIHNRTKY